MKPALRIKAHISEGHTIRGVGIEINGYGNLAKDKNTSIFQQRIIVQLSTDIFTKIENILRIDGFARSTIMIKLKISSDKRAEDKAKKVREEMLFAKIMRGVE